VSPPGHSRGKELTWCRRLAGGQAGGFAAAGVGRWDEPWFCGWRLGSARRAEATVVGSRVEVTTGGGGWEGEDERKVASHGLSRRRAARAAWCWH